VLCLLAGIVSLAGLFPVGLVVVAVAGMLRELLAEFNSVVVVSTSLSSSFREYSPSSSTVRVKEVSLTTRK
jgi:hypothetical protein